MSRVSTRLMSHRAAPPGPDSPSRARACVYLIFPVLHSTLYCLMEKFILVFIDGFRYLMTPEELEEFLDNQ